MKDIHQQRILHGPAIIDYADGAKSMGELFLRRMTEQGNFVGLVNNIYFYSNL